MTMSKSLASYVGVQVSRLRDICGFSLDATAREDKAVRGLVSEPIPASKFGHVYRQRKSGKRLHIEFKALALHQEDHSTQAALRNVLRNTRQEVVTYDHSRVIVWDRPDTSLSDYYNASYIDGYNGPREYIASQGPTCKDVSIFWHLVWQEGVSCIVMATGLFENAMQQCDKYWADEPRDHVQHGKIHVCHEKTTSLAQLVIRTFRVHKEGSASSRMVTHFEMIALFEERPDPALILDVRRRVSELTVSNTGPVLVHCRCGGGRTSVYIAVDYCLQQLQAEDRVDVYSSVLHLRRFRKNMVRTLSQYVQIYETVTMYLQCGLTVYPAHLLPPAYHLHYAREARNQKLETEFQTLQCVVPRLTVGDCASGHRVENRNKSRDIMMLPPESARPYLTTADCGDGGTDFINSAYVDGYHDESMFVVTQWPLRRTMTDLWRLLFDFKITSLVLTSDPPKFSRSYPRFWPKEIYQVQNYGPVSVRYLSCDHRSLLTIRTFAIRKLMNSLVGCQLRQDEVIVRMFQIQGTPKSLSGCALTNRRSRTLTRGHDSSRSRGRSKGCESDLSRSRRGSRPGRSSSRSPSDVGVQSKSLLAAMEQVEEWQKENQSKKPVCIMSKDGCSQVGVYCAIKICLDQLKAEREVDVFSAVRLVRKNRPQLVPTLEEYRYIYTFLYNILSRPAWRPELQLSDSASKCWWNDVGRQTTPDLLTNAKLASGLNGVYYTGASGHFPGMGLDEGMVDPFLEDGRQHGLSTCRLSPIKSRGHVISHSFPPPKENDYHTAATSPVAKSQASQDPTSPTIPTPPHQELRELQLRPNLHEALLTAPSQSQWTNVLDGSAIRSTHVLVPRQYVCCTTSSTDNHCNSNATASSPTTGTPPVTPLPLSTPSSSTSSTSPHVSNDLPNPQRSPLPWLSIDRPDSVTPEREPRDVHFVYNSAFTSLPSSSQSHLCPGTHLEPDLDTYRKHSLSSYSSLSFHSCCSEISLLNSVPSENTTTTVTTTAVTICSSSTRNGRLKRQSDVRSSTSKDRKSLTKSRSLSPARYSNGVKTLVAGTADDPWPPLRKASADQSAHPGSHTFAFVHASYASIEDSLDAWGKTSSPTWRSV